MKSIMTFVNDGISTETVLVSPSRPEVLLENLCDIIPIHSYKSLTSFLTSLSGYKINGYEGTYFREKLTIPLTFRDSTFIIYDQKLTEEQLEKKIVEFMERFTFKIGDRTLPYFANLLTETVMKKETPELKRLDAMTEDLLEATNSILGLNSREDLRFLYSKGKPFHPLEIANIRNSLPQYS